MSTLFVNNLNTASGTDITVPTGKKLVVTDTGGLAVPGTVVQVVQGHALGSVTSDTGSFVESGIDVNITPKFASSKIFIQATAPCDSDANGRQIFLTLYRDSTRVDSSVISGSYGLGTWYGGSSRNIGNTTIQFLDSPNSTSQLHYELYFRSAANGSTVEVCTQSCAGVIMCMEIAQ